MNPADAFMVLVLGLGLSCGFAFLAICLLDHIKKYEKKAVEEPPKDEARSYSKEDLKRDLLDPKYSTEDILEKCKNFPPEEIENLLKDLKLNDRKAERLRWYASMLAKQGELKVVPPPIKPVVIAVKGTFEPCKVCSRAREHYSYYPPLRNEKYPCSTCGGTGYVVIQNG
jgi:hypothetical protein